MAQTQMVKKKKKIKKRWVILGVVAALAAALLIVPQMLARKAISGMLRMSDLTTVSRMDLQSTISGTGTVESANATSVYL